MQPLRGKSERWVAGSFEDCLDAAIHVAALAERTISILTPDLEPGILDQEKFLDAVKRLVLAKRYARVRVLISEPHRTIRTGNKLVAVARRLQTYIHLRNLHSDYQEDTRDAYILADREALLYRVDAHKWQGIADTYAPELAERYADRFEEMWQASAYKQNLRELSV